MECPVCKERMAEVVKYGNEIYQCFNCNHETPKESSKQ